MTFDPDRFLESSGAEIRRARLERGLSREVLAEMAGVHPNTLGFAERGDRDLNSITQTRLLLALRCECLLLCQRGVKPVLGDGHSGVEACRAWRDPQFAALIGKAIRLRRVSLGLTLEKVAGDAVLHRNTLWNIERGLVLASGLSLYRVYLALGVRALVPYDSGLSLE